VAAVDQNQEVRRQEIRVLVAYPGQKFLAIHSMVERVYTANQLALVVGIQEFVDAGFARPFDLDMVGIPYY